MAPLAFSPWLFLAQGDSSGFGDFLTQVSGLLGLTCIAGLIWVALTAFVLQRAAERRRRAEQGLAPLPSLYNSLWQRLRASTGDRTIEGRLAGPAAPAPRSTPRPAPEPDLTLLTADLPEPDLDALLYADDAPEEAPEEMPAEPREMPDEVAEAVELDEMPAPPAGAPHPAPFDDAPPPAEAPAADPAAPDAEPEDSIELLRVWRDLSTGALIVEMGGRRFQSLDELRGAELERRFSGVVRDLTALAARPPSAPAGTPRPATEDRADRPPQPGNVLRQMTRVAMGQTPAPPEAPESGTIADEIEDLLQNRLAGRAEFRGRDIHVTPSLHGGVQIQVDDRVYEGVGEIDDPAVRALLEDVVREWEASQ